MKPVNSHIHIRDIDQKLFNYLFLNKVATSEQIKRDIFESISHQAIYKRLNKLMKFGYITANYHKELNGRLVYSLTTKTFNQYIDGKSYLSKTKQLLSNSILHDLDLVDIRCKLKRFKQVKDYYTENLLKSGLSSLDAKTLEDFKGFQFDAIININRGSQIFLLPLEYERSLKFAARYLEYFKKLYARPEISAILYIGHNQKMLHKIQSYEKSMVQNAWPKVFYISLSDLLDHNTVSFQNIKNEKITLNNTVASPIQLATGDFI